MDATADGASAEIHPPACLPTLLAVAVAPVLLLVAGCNPAIGDSCKTSADCSVSGVRICDIAQPGGYCTVRGCDPGTCPGNNVCVEWRGTPDRTAETWCMKRCSKDGGCRQGAGYRCVRDGDPRLTRDGEVLATVLEEEDGVGFCAAVEVEMGRPTIDAGPISDAMIPDAPGFDSALMSDAGDAAMMSDADMMSDAGDADMMSDADMTSDAGDASPADAATD